MKSCCAVTTNAAPRTRWRRVLWTGAVVAVALSLPTYTLWGGGAEQRRNATAATEYARPMHPDVTGGKPGVCPKCGMKLEPKPAPKPSSR